MSKLVVCAVAALSLSGCLFAASYSSKERFMTVAREFNDDVRWGRLDEASRKVPAESRQRFYERRKSLEEELEIADHDLIAIEIDKSDKKVTRATVKVDWAWTLKRAGIVEKTTTKQSWEERSGGWVMVREERLRGAPLAIFDEAPKSRASAQ
jgi:hypothetical protein